MSEANVSDNRVFLRGRLAETAQAKTLPSGDLMSTFRLTVERPASERGRVDSVECVTMRARARNTVQRARAGDVLEVSGSLRRRFWRGAGGVASRYAVDVESARLLRRAASPCADRASAASQGRTQASA